MRTYILKLEVKPDGAISARYIDNAKDEYSLLLPEGKDKIKLPGDDETINILVNILRDSRLKGDEEYELLGTFLYNALLDNNIGEKLHAWRCDDEVSYVKIELNFIGNKNPYANWPWEYMFCKAGTHGHNTGYFVSADPKIVMTRPVNKALEETTEPLRILLVAPGPSAAIADAGGKIRKMFGLSLLSYESLFATIEEIVAPYKKIIELTRLVAEEKENEIGEKAYILDKDAFGEKVASIQPHVIHFYGHGRVVNNKGQLAFTKVTGGHDWVDEDTFANKVKLSSNIKFVFLQACESAALAPHKAISGVARQLVSSSVPAVVAMQCRINQDSAINFTKAFYKVLAEEGIIDAAVQSGRVCIAEAKKKSADSDLEEKDFAFGIPVLYIKDRGPLFKKAQVVNIEIVESKESDQHQKFNCFKCDAQLPLKTKFCINDCGEFVDKPNPSCTIKECPRKILRWFKRCPICNTENKDYLPQ